MIEQQKLDMYWQLVNNPWIDKNDKPKSFEDFKKGFEEDSTAPEHGLRGRPPSGAEGGMSEKEVKSFITTKT